MIKKIWFKALFFCFSGKMSLLKSQIKPIDIYPIIYKFNDN